MLHQFLIVFLLYEGAHALIIEVNSEIHVAEK